MNPSEFDKKVLELTKRVPAGKVTTYGEIAKVLNTKAYRAVGQALRRNPNPVEIPCHRIVSSDGRLGGYAGKLNSRKKKELLIKEGIEIKNNRIDLKKYMHRFLD
jgi:methylated-DNA-[protein]-cysteine S-methyltransferase